MRSRLSAPARLLLASLVVLAVLAAAPAAAQDETTTTTDEVEDIPPIIPEPNSGSAPEDAGDRGGWLQSGLFVLVVAGIGVIGFLIVRESRKARDRRGF